MQSKLQNWHQRLLRVLHTKSNITGGLIMKKQLTINEFMPDSEKDLTYLASLINGYTFEPSLFFVSQLSNGRYYWAIRFERADMEVLISSIEFALVRDILIDISKLADFFYDKYIIELPYPQFSATTET